MTTATAEIDGKQKREQLDMHSFYFKPHREWGGESRKCCRSCIDDVDLRGVETAGGGVGGAGRRGDERGVKFEKGASYL